MKLNEFLESSHEYIKYKVSLHDTYREANMKLGESLHEDAGRPFRRSEHLVGTLQKNMKNLLIQKETIEGEINVLKAYGKMIEAKNSLEHLLGEKIEYYLLDSILTNPIKSGIYPLLSTYVQELSTIVEKYPLDRLDELEMYREYVYETLLGKIEKWNNKKLIKLYEEDRISTENILFDIHRDQYGEVSESDKERIRAESEDIF